MEVSDKVQGGHPGLQAELRSTHQEEDGRDKENPGLHGITVIQDQYYNVHGCYQVRHHTRLLRTPGGRSAPRQDSEPRDSPEQVLARHLQAALLCPERDHPLTILDQTNHRRQRDIGGRPAAPIWSWAALYAHLNT